MPTNFSIYQVFRKSVYHIVGKTKNHCSCKKTNPEFVKVSLISQEMIFILPIAICSVLRAKIGRRNKVTSSKAHLSFAKRQEMQYHHYSITQNVVFVQLCCAIFYILGMFSITTTASRIAINIFIYILIFIFVAYTCLALLKSCTLETLIINSLWRFYIVLKSFAN